MDRYERLERIDYKSARDVVTEADHLSEELIIDADPGAPPGRRDPRRGERRARAVAGEAPTSGRGRVWIIDPLDGTMNYANGIPFFCVSIALVVEGGRPVGRRPRPDPRRDVRRHGRRPGDPLRRSGRRATHHGVGQGQA